ncbi:hypothetical protein BDZ85DRAFT_2477 [Elsinoe ampelina]|uniref:AAA+ ATPase domain-containing protein n=1 Tax=Elsinoe ampelina TaxID=302913 RepID=A0A6A6GP19_9PEZI|nr:hypothetical protein BDZ85DRAFT_2477 [Elsinoe ampelina]
MAAVETAKVLEAPKVETNDVAVNGNGDREGLNKTQLTLKEEVVRLSEQLLEMDKSIKDLHKKLNEDAIPIAETNGTTAKENENKPPVDGEENSKSPKKHVQVVINRADDTGDRKDYSPSSAQDADEKTKKKQEYGVLLRRNLDLRNPGTGEIEIFDRDARDLLRKLLAHYPSHQFIGEQVELSSPYEALIMNWDLLWEDCNQPTGDMKLSNARAIVKDLLEELKVLSGDAKLDAYLKIRDDLKRQNLITFESLWTIFPPGVLVKGNIFLRGGKQDQIFIVEDNIQPWPQEPETIRTRAPLKWSLECWLYDFTGKDFTKRRVRLFIESFEGQKPITSLPFYPLAYMERTARDDLEKRLKTRGESFRKFCVGSMGDGSERQNGKMMFNYEGAAILEKQGFRGVQNADDSDDELDSRFSLSRMKRYLEKKSRGTKMQPFTRLTETNVMVDFESYFRYGPEYASIGDTAVFDDVYACPCKECTTNEAQKRLFKPHYDGMSGHESETWEDLQYMLCPPRVLGYVLKEKQWAQLAVENLREIPAQNHEEVMRNLYLAGKNSGQDQKRLLFGLVKHHGQHENDPEDIVAEKGKGLIFLLYGAPGVGKTSTAQMIAKAARKPLFSIGVADVGTKARQVESNLETIFELATTWRAILLIDEADVFLQSRSHGGAGPSAEGSALVSVFLRVLEYYRGIMFLTTNQIAQFDVAVQSRVHIALKYDKLDEDQTEKIFKSFVDKYKEQGGIDSREHEAIIEYGKEDFVFKGFDGRQIRNIVTSAMGYARGRGQSQMTKKDIIAVVKNVDSFRQDLSGAMMLWRKQQEGTRMS